VRVRRSGALVALGVVVALAGCSANPAPVVDTTQTATTTPAPARPARTSVVVAVDDLGTGFNPHLLADQSPVGTAVANLVLPSVFRPSEASSGWTVDTSLVTSAKVTSTAPFTVTYVLRDEAQWSDGAPVAAEDFRYLWQQMTTQPGVVDPAGYGLVNDVRSSGGGKTVTVTFSASYPAWRQLFTGLLPSHLLKDSPGGFTGALDNSLTLSASRFSVASVDRDRGEVLLQRNDRFWDAPAALDEILLRRDGTAGQLAESLRTGDAQVAMVRANVATRSQVRGVPGLSTSDVAQPTVMQVAVDTQDPRLADAGVRRGLLGLLDPDVLTTIGTGLDSATDPRVGRARAQVLAPSQPGYQATEPTPLTVAQARGLLAAGGYTFSDGHYRQGAAVLSLVIGADKADPVATTVAQSAADQLTVAGVDATVSPLPAAQLYGTALPSGTVDLVVGRAAVGGDLATTLASRFSCPTTPGGPEPTTGAPKPTASSQPTSSQSTSSQSTSSQPTSSQPTSSQPTSSAPTGTAAPAVRAGNVSGLCDPQIDSQVRQALTGAASATDVAARLEPLLWNQGAVLPLYQDSVLFSVRFDVAGVNPPGPLLGGPLASAAAWTKAGS
jgi:ABC-type transport system substrate-binding protein